MKETELTYGVFLTRGQPFHCGHLSVIKTALSENDRVLVIIGSSDKCGNSRNPYDISIREYVLKKLMDSLKPDERSRISYITLQDWSSDKDIPYESSDGKSGLGFEKVNSEWGLYFYYNVVNVIGRKDFSMYYNDDPEIIGNWFPPAVFNRVTIKASPRTEFSSSKVRHAMEEGNMNYLEEAMPFADRQDIELLINKLLEA